MRGVKDQHDIKFVGASVYPVVVSCTCLVDTSTVQVLVISVVKKLFNTMFVFVRVRYCLCTLS